MRQADRQLTGIKVYTCRVQAFDREIERIRDGDKTRKDGDGSWQVGTRLELDKRPIPHSRKLDFAKYCQSLHHAIQLSRGGIVFPLFALLLLT